MPTDRPFCETCSTKYGRQLWASCCLCNAGVDFTFVSPGGPHPDRDWHAPVRQKPEPKPSEKPKTYAAPPIAFNPRGRR